MTYQYEWINCDRCTILMEDGNRNSELEVSHHMSTFRLFRCLDPERSEKDRLLISKKESSGSNSSSFYLDLFIYLRGEGRTEEEGES